MRLIDADALRDKLHKLASDDWNQMCRTFWANVYNECADMVDDQPTIEPQKWVPVSERLPEIPKGCDVYWCSECGDVSADEYIVMIKGATLPTALFWDGKHWFDINGEQTLFPVIAWMQFPEAYKEDNNA